MIGLDSRDVDDLVGRYEPDSLYEVVERIDKTTALDVLPTDVTA